MERIYKAGRILGRVAAASFVFFWGAVLLIAIVPALWHSWTAPPPTPAEQAAQHERDTIANKVNEHRRFLCRAAAACKKYGEVRLECATAGNFKTCVRIKMGDDADYSDTCSGYVEGAPAVSLPPKTPNVVECFFLTLFQ